LLKGNPRRRKNSLCNIEDEITELVNVNQQTVTNWILQKKQDIGKLVIFPDSLQIYDDLSN